jgi:hypothetical protein
MVKGNVLPIRKEIRVEVGSLCQRSSQYLAVRLPPEWFPLGMIYDRRERGPVGISEGVDRKGHWEGSSLSVSSLYPLPSTIYSSEILTLLIITLGVG